MTLGIPGTTSTWDAVSGTCTFPSAYEVDFYYSRVGKKDNPQYQLISGKTTESSTSNPWIFKRPDATQEQTFMAILTVRFHEIDQDAELFVPSTPNYFPKVKRVRPDFVY